MVFWELFVAVVIPATAAAVGVIRYFWKKEKCFLAMRNKIRALDEHDQNSIDEHDGFHERIGQLETDATEIKIYLKLLLDNAGIKYQ